jgi:hypothetical protein
MKPAPARPVRFSAETALPSAPGIADEFQDFCLNEEARVRRQAQRLAQRGQWARAEALSDIAISLARLVQRRF